MDDLGVGVAGVSLRLEIVHLCPDGALDGMPLAHPDDVLGLEQQLGAPGRAVRAGSDGLALVPRPGEGPVRERVPVPAVAAVWPHVMGVPFGDLSMHAGPQLVACLPAWQRV